jgi:hypothetical protein
MEIGIGLPQMALGYGATTTVDWARVADQGRFASISCLEAAAALVALRGTS